jgi:hypothetical protein
MNSLIPYEMLFCKEIRKSLTILKSIHEKRPIAPFNLLLFLFLCSIYSGAGPETGSAVNQQRAVD